MKVTLTKEAERQYKKLRQSDKNKIYKKLQVLERDHQAGKKLTGKLSGLSSLRAWPYRIIYQVKNAKNEVWVISILHRQGAYK